MKKKFNDSEYPIFEIVVDDTTNTGIRLLSIVNQPAIEMKGIAFSSDGATEKNFEFQEQKDKQIIIGPAMIPNMKILRKTPDNQKYYTVFRPETIEKMVQKFNSFGSNRRINVDHSNQMVDGYILENWIVEDMFYDKSKKYGFDVPVGTWMVTIKIEDQEFWNTQVKDLGKFGFSVEGIMGEKPYEYSSVMNFQDMIEDIIDKLSNDELNELLKDLDYKKKSFDGVKDKYELNILNGLECRGISEDEFDDIIYLDELNEDDEWFKHQFASIPKIKTDSDNPTYKPSKEIKKNAKKTLKNKTKEYKKYFKYSGPNDEKTRLFCWYLLATNKLFSQEDLDDLSSSLRYDVQEFCGMYNCRHNWKEVIATKKMTTPSTPLDAKDTANLREGSVYNGKDQWK